MDQQDDRAVPGASGRTDQPAPVWGGAADGAGPDSAAPQWAVPAGGGHEPAAHDQSTQDQPPQGQPALGWGAPQQYPAGASSRSGKGNWTAKKGVLVGGVAVVVAAAAGAGAYAAGNGTAAASTNNGPGAGATGQSGPGGQSGMTGQGGTGMDGGSGGLGMGSAGLNAALHSEYVVLQDSGYVTMAGQTGTVTEVSATSLTVTSEDGFSRTYAVGSGVQVCRCAGDAGDAAAGEQDHFQSAQPVQRNHRSHRPRDSPEGFGHLHCPGHPTASGRLRRGSGLGHQQQLTRTA